MCHQEGRRRKEIGKEEQSLYCRIDLFESGRCLHIAQLQVARQSCSIMIHVGLPPLPLHLRPHANKRYVEGTSIYTIWDSIRYDHTDCPTDALSFEKLFTFFPAVV